MRRIILFRFHDQFDICENRLAILRAHNPATPIFGLFGGRATDFARAQQLDLDHCYLVPADDPQWKWRNGDLCARSWFTEFGYRVPFDLAHFIEWDMIMLDSVSTLFDHIRGGVALTMCRPPQTLANWWWTAPGRKYSFELEVLQQHIHKRFGKTVTPARGGFCGAALSRQFLERYAAEEVPLLSNDEVRVVCYARAWDMRVHDSNFCSSKFRFDDNLTTAEIAAGIKEGIRAFHPARTALISLDAEGNVDSIAEVGRG